MFGIGPAEFIVILLIALIVVGPERLPELARKAGQTVNDLRRVYTNLRSQLGPDFDEVEQHVRALRQMDPRREISNIGKRVFDGLSDDVGPDVMQTLRTPLNAQVGELHNEILEAARLGQAPTSSADYPYAVPQITESTIAPPANVVATRQSVERIGHDLLNDELLDEPLADSTAERPTT